MHRHRVHTQRSKGKRNGRQRTNRPTSEKKCPGADREVDEQADIHTDQTGRHADRHAGHTGRHAGRQTSKHEARHADREG